MSWAQAAPNPGLAVGYVNRPMVGPTGANHAAGDLFDMYRVNLVAGQLIELNFGDATSADLDLGIWDLAGNLLTVSSGTTRSECLRISRSGSYVISVFAYSGASAYELSWGAQPLQSSCPNVLSSADASGAIRPGELVAAPARGRDTASAAATEAASEGARAYARSAGLAVRADSGAGGPMLLQLPAAAADRARVRSAIAAGAGPRVAAASGAGSAPAPDDASAEGRAAWDTALAAKALQATGRYAWVEPNRSASTQQVAAGGWPPNDADLWRQPHLDLIRLPDALRAYASLSPAPGYTPIVAVLDTGIVADHPDLRRMLVPGFDFVADVLNGGDGNGIDANADDAGRLGDRSGFHGTHVAGTIAAEGYNGQGGIGVAPMARLMPVRVLGVTGSGSGFDIAQGIRFAAGLPNSSGTLPARRADVINLSLGGVGACPAIYAEAVAAARAAGTLVIAAAGNDSLGVVSSPANCPGVVSVSALSYDGRLASYSNYGAGLWVTAPGGDPSRASPAGPDRIHSTSATFSGALRIPFYTGQNGTSMATPHVAGVAALMRAVRPSMTPAEFDAWLSSGQITRDVDAPGYDQRTGYGLIDAARAVLLAAGASSAPVSSLPTLAASAVVLDFGSTLTERSLTLQRVNGSTDEPASFGSDALNAGAVSLRYDTGGNPPGGPYRLIVSLNRSLLVPGENAVRLRINTAQGRQVTVDMTITPRPPAFTGNRGAGTLYALALDVDTLDNIAEATLTDTATLVGYVISGVPGGRRVVVAAGSDLDNDGFICGAAEPCGLYPVLAASPTVLDTSRSHVNISFGLDSGGIRASSAGAGAGPGAGAGGSGSAWPVRGIARRLP